VRLSTRNQLAGTVTAINPGSVMATVKVDVSGQEVTAAVTKEAVEDLGLTVGGPGHRPGEVHRGHAGRRRLTRGLPAQVRRRRR
jgi:molybdopterin-binding protein